MSGSSAKKVLVPAFSLVLLLAFAGVASAHVHTYDRTLSIAVTSSGNSYTFTGNLSVTSDGQLATGECVAPATFVLYKDGGAIATSTTSTGTYSFTRTVTGSPTFYTRVEQSLGNITHPHAHTCASVQSNTIDKNGDVVSPGSSPAAATRFGLVLGLTAA